MNPTFCKAWPFRSSMLLLCSLTVLGTQSIKAQDVPLNARVDQIFAEWNKADSPGCALAVIKDGRVVYKRGYGMASLEQSAPISPASVFYIASTSKQFTAAAFALLAQQGKISLDDDIRKYLPELPRYESPITIRHLIHHTSGIRDYLALLPLGGGLYEDVITDEELLALLSRQKSLNFKPGERFLYSNSGYVLLSMIVKRASGQSLRQFAEANIFKPLGMTATHFHDDRMEVVKHRVTGYAPGPGGFRLDHLWNFDRVGDGGLLTTIEDLALWDRNFYDVKVGGKELIAQLLTPGALNTGEKLDYAFGLTIGAYKGLKMVSHGGAFMGFRAQMIRFPEQRFAVICLCNLGSINPTRLARQVADLYLASQLTEEAAAKEKPTELPESELKDKTGIYLSETGDLWRLAVKDGKLTLNVSGITLQLAPLSATRFRSVDGPVEIGVEFKGSNARILRVIVEGQKPETLEAVELVSPAPELLTEYAGDYYSDELDVTYSLTVKDGKLLLRYKNAAESSLTPTLKDAFIATSSSFSFTRDERHRISGFTLNAGGVRNIRFIKKTG